MLTDKDKCDLVRYIEGVIACANSDLSRADVAVTVSKMTIHFLIEHPDLCASELEDFLSNQEYAEQEIERLLQNGML